MWLLLLLPLLLCVAGAHDSGYSSHIYLPPQPSLRVQQLTPAESTTATTSSVSVPDVGQDPVAFDYGYSREPLYSAGQPSSSVGPVELPALVEQQCYATTGPAKVQNVRSCREQQIINRLLANYSSAVRPTGFVLNPDGSIPTTVVNVTVVILSLSSFNDVTMEFIGQLKFQQEWFDPRLQFPHEDYHEQSWLTLGSDKSVWTPDTFFHNEQEGHEHTIDRYNRVIRIRHDGRVRYHKRLTMAFSCPMVLKLFPHDDQICVIDFGSYAYTDSDIRYRWINVTLKDEANSNLPKFLLAGCAMQICDSNTTTGVYGCLRIQLKLHREFSFFFMTLYIPSCMLVSVSFVSFWIDWRSAPSRVPLTIVTLLTVTTQANGINANLPPVSYTKAIDLWIGACTIFVFGALIEFAVVNYVGSNEEMSSAATVATTVPFHVATNNNSKGNNNLYNNNNNFMDKQQLSGHGKQMMFASEAPPELKCLMVPRPVVRPIVKPYGSEGALPLPYANDYNYQPPSYDAALMQRQPPALMTSSVMSAPAAPAMTPYNGIRKRPAAQAGAIANYQTMSSSVCVPGSYNWATQGHPSRPVMALPQPGYYALNNNNNNNSAQYTNNCMRFDPALTNSADETQALLMKPPPQVPTGGTGGIEADKYHKRLTQPTQAMQPQQQQQKRRRRFVLFERGPGRAERIDQFARVLFPIGFVLFNVIYWTKFLRTVEREEGCQFDLDQHKT